MALGERAKHRLRLLAGLLRRHGQKFDVARDKFYDEIQLVAATLPIERQAELKALVDWLEDYDSVEYETAVAKEGPKRRALSAKPLSKTK